MNDQDSVFGKGLGKVGFRTIVIPPNHQIQAGVTREALFRFLDRDYDRVVGERGRDVFGDHLYDTIADFFRGEEAQIFVKGSEGRLLGLDDVAVGSKTIWNFAKAQKVTSPSLKTLHSLWVYCVLRDEALLWRLINSSVRHAWPKELHDFFFGSKASLELPPVVEGIYHVDAIRKAKSHGTNRYLALRSLPDPGTFAAVEINYPGTKAWPPEGKIDYDIDLAYGFLCASASYWPLLMVDNDHFGTRLSYVAEGKLGSGNLQMISMVDGDVRRTFAFSAPLSFSPDAKVQSGLQTLPTSQLIKVTNAALYLSLSKKFDKIINRMYYVT